MEHWADYLIFALFLCISLAIGLYFSLTGGKQRTTEEFIMANRSLKVLPASLSLLVSFQSAIMILGNVAEVYVGGTSAWIQGLLSATIAISLNCWLFVPWIYPLRLTSIYRLLEVRFGMRAVRVFGACLGIMGQVIYMGTAVLAPSMALQTASGFPARASIPIMAVLCIIYTTLGGMKAVVWTDVFQSLIMLTGMLTIMIKGLVEVGGFGAAFTLVGQEDRLQWFRLSPDPTVRHTLWGYLFGNTAGWIATYTFEQSSVQRICAIRTLTGARMAVMLNIPALIVMTSVACMTGVVVLAYYVQRNCDPVASGTISKPNELLPLFVKEVFRDVPGFGGLFLATLYSGALSSVSSCLSGAATNTWDDILKWKLPNLTEYQSTLVNKGLVVLYGLIATGLAFIIAEIPGPITQVSISLFGAIQGPMTGLFLLGGIKYFYWCNGKGALIGGVLGLVANAWLTTGANFVPSKYRPLPSFAVTNCSMSTNATVPIYQTISGIQHFYSMDYLWKTLFGALVTMTTAMLFSIIIIGCERLWKRCAADKAAIGQTDTKEDVPKRMADTSIPDVPSYLFIRLRRHTSKQLLQKEVVPGKNDADLEMKLEATDL